MDFHQAGLYAVPDKASRVENKFHVTLGKQLFLPTNSEPDSLKALTAAVDGMPSITA
ncbi:hypothetical protein P0D88_34125 [Paraburkholderia sp. RL18-103-BIB-C]